jgi:single-strand DNA-binding protein
MRVNNVVIGGVVGRDPEVKSTTTGKTVASFSIAVDNGKDRESDWYEINAWETSAKIVQDMVVKGSLVVVSGRLSQNKWEDKEGKKHTRVLVTATSINLVGGKRKEGSGGSSTANAVDDSEIPF